MTWAELGVELNKLKIPTGLGGSYIEPDFAHFSWASAPAGDYGVYAEESGRNIFTADDRNECRAMRGYVSWFTRTDSLTVPNAIEALFTSLQETCVLAWYLNTVQYEDDTHFLHYEWVVELA